MRFFPVGRGVSYDPRTARQGGTAADTAGPHFRPGASVHGRGTCLQTRRGVFGEKLNEYP